MRPIPMLVQMQQITKTDKLRNGYNAVLITNKGTNICTVNSMPLEPGDSIGWSFNQGEVDKSDVQVTFPDGIAGNVWVVYTFYNF